MTTFGNNFKPRAAWHHMCKAVFDCIRRIRYRVAEIRLHTTKCAPTAAGGTRIVGSTLAPHWLKRRAIAIVARRTFGVILFCIVLCAFVVDTFGGSIRTRVRTRCGRFAACAPAIRPRSLTRPLSDHTTSAKMRSSTCGVFSPPAQHATLCAHGAIVCCTSPSCGGAGGSGGCGACACLPTAVCAVPPLGAAAASHLLPQRSLNTLFAVFAESDCGESGARWSHTVSVSSLCGGSAAQESHNVAVSAVRCERHIAHVRGGREAAVGVRGVRAERAARLRVR
jgi:hypothetical protein